MSILYIPVFLIFFGLLLQFDFNTLLHVCKIKYILSIVLWKYLNYEFVSSKGWVGPFFSSQKSMTFVCYQWQLDGGGWRRPVFLATSGGSLDSSTYLLSAGMMMIKVTLQGQSNLILRCTNDILPSFQWLYYDHFD